MYWVRSVKEKKVFDVLRNLASNRIKPVCFCLFFLKIAGLPRALNKFMCNVSLWFVFSTQHFQVYGVIAFFFFFLREHQFTFHAILVRVTSWGILHLEPQQGGVVCVCVCVHVCVTGFNWHNQKECISWRVCFLLLLWQITEDLNGLKQYKYITS